MTRTSEALVGTLSLQVMNAVGRRIVGGEFACGKTLPTEPVLCGEFGVSRTTVREAMRKLHGKGLVQIGPKVGTTVKSAEFWNQLDSDVLRWRVETGPDEDILAQLYELRSALEPAASRLAAYAGSDAERAAIRTALDRIEESIGDVDATIAADISFHIAIIEASHNIFFVSMIAAIRTALGIAFRLRAKRRGFPKSELDLHSKIAVAIVARQGEAAAELMTQLLAASRRSAQLPDAPKSRKVARGPSLITRSRSAAKQKGDR